MSYRGFLPERFQFNTDKSAENCFTLKRRAMEILIYKIRRTLNDMFSFRAARRTAVEWKLRKRTLVPIWLINLSALAWDKWLNQRPRNVDPPHFSCLCSCSVFVRSFISSTCRMWSFLCVSSSFCVFIPFGFSWCHPCLPLPRLVCSVAPLDFNPPLPHRLSILYLFIR